MRTQFTPDQLADPEIRVADGILRACVHCGFCTATCPTYTIKGDELDSPRGRIYLIKEMLERADEPPPPTTVTHVDRCLTCLSCMTTCPSGVHYMHLVDLARERIEREHVRDPADRAFRALLAKVLPNRRLFRAAFAAARLGLGIAPGLRSAGWLPARLRALLALTPRRPPAPATLPDQPVHSASGTRRMRVALLTGCVQPTLAPHVNDATIRLLTRLGCEVVVAPKAECCGALTHHLGHGDAARASARATIAAWIAEAERNGLDAIVVNASGCGTMIKDYGHVFRDDPEWAAPAARVAGLAKDVTEVLMTLEFPAGTAPAGAPVVAYHAACSQQHGQKLREPPRELLRRAGFEVREIPDGHLCCGSAGTYNMLQPELADILKARKLAAIATTGAGVVAAGNLGCLTQLTTENGIPLVHTVELLDWATGGPAPSLPQPVVTRPGRLHT